jgi:hypothetical protein
VYDLLDRWLNAKDGNPFDGTWRDLETGTDPQWATPEEADGANDGPGMPDEPITTRLEGPWGLPWWDAVEDPYKRVFDVAVSADPLPWSPQEDVGGLPMLGAYEGAYRTRGPVTAWGHEPSGGLSGDQAIGRIMRFPANIPERFDPYGVWNTDPRDDLAAAMAVDELPYYSDAQTTQNLLLWPGGVD